MAGLQHAVEEEQRNAAGHTAAFEKGAPHYVVSTSCHVQQLLSQNWAHQLGMGYILPPDHWRNAAARWGGRASKWDGNRARAPALGDLT